MPEFRRVSAHLVSGTGENDYDALSQVRVNGALLEEILFSDVPCAADESKE